MEEATKRTEAPECTFTMELKEIGTVAVLGDLWSEYAKNAATVTNHIHIAAKARCDE